MASLAWRCQVSFFEAGQHPFVSGRNTKLLYSVCYSDKGELFAWGCNEVGQIKPGQISTIFREPVHVNLGERVGKILDIAMGDMSTYVLNGKGLLLSMFPDL